MPSTTAVVMVAQDYGFNVIWIQQVAEQLTTLFRYEHLLCCSRGG